MKIKLKQIVDSEESLAVLLETKIPVKTAYWLNRFVQKIQPELKNFSERRMELFKEFGEEDKENNKWSIKPENSEKFVEEITKVLDIEVDVEIDKFKIEDLGDAQIESKHIINLNYLFKDEN